MAARPTLKDQLFSLMSSLTTEELKALKDMNLSEEFEERETSARERSRGEESLTTEIVTRMCLRHDLPILSPEHYECACGRNPSLLGEGAFGIARLNREKGLVVKVT